MQRAVVNSAPAKRPRTFEPYEIVVVPAPLSEEQRSGAYGCMCDVYGGDFATNGFGEDLLARMGESGNLFAMAFLDGEVVSHAMVAYDGSVGLLGGVCTRLAHQRKGLSRELTRRLIINSEHMPRWMVLGTGSRTAANIYFSCGFHGLNGGLSQAAKGYNDNDEGEWIMVRDSKRVPSLGPMLEVNEPFDIGAYLLPGSVMAESLGRRHWGAAVLLLNVAPGARKLGLFGIDDGLNAELRLAQAVRDGDPVTVAVHTESRRIFGIAFHDKLSGLEVYTIGPAAINTTLVGGAQIVQTALPSPERAEFWERGYLVFPGLLATEAPEVRAKMDAMLHERGAEATADWNAVNTGGAEYVLAVDEKGTPIPGKILKVQAVALGLPAILDVLGSPKIREKIEALFSFLGQEVPGHVDVFGTKFFPMWPGSVSVSWHQDCHYFGTASPRIISCGIYLEDADVENGCLQVVPGSHTRGIFQHALGTGTWAQGEWASPGTNAEVVDVVVPAGSVVLFNAMLLHGARRNRHAKRTRYSVFGHFVPRSLGFSWRGTDFSHGVYKDRHAIY